MISTLNEIITLWYDVNYLRLVVSKILTENPELAKNLNEEAFNECRKQAQECVKKRFPEISLNFDGSIKPEENPSPTTHEEHFDVSHLPSNEE